MLGENPISGSDRGVRWEDRFVLPHFKSCEFKVWSTCYSFVKVDKGVAGGDWQTFVWVASHNAAPPQLPSSLPWPEPKATSSNTTTQASEKSAATEENVLTAVDPERFSAHEKYLKKMPFMHRFFSEQDSEIGTQYSLVQNGNRINGARRFLCGIG